MLAFLKSLWDAIISINKVVEKALPSDELRDKQFEVKKPTLSESQVKAIADKRNRLADEMFGDLVRHPEISIENKVNFEAKELEPEERKLLIELLTERLNASPVYNRLKSKKSKFRL